MNWIGEANLNFLTGKDNLLADSDNEDSLIENYELREDYSIELREDYTKELRQNG